MQRAAVHPQQQRRRDVGADAPAGSTSQARSGVPSAAVALDLGERAGQVGAARRARAGTSGCWSARAGVEPHGRRRRVDRRAQRVDPAPVRARPAGRCRRRRRRVSRTGSPSAARSTRKTGARPWSSAANTSAAPSGVQRGRVRPAVPARRDVRALAPSPGRGRQRACRAARRRSSGARRAPRRRRPSGENAGGAVLLGRVVEQHAALPGRVSIDTRREAAATALGALPVVTTRAAVGARRQVGARRGRARAPASGRAARSARARGRRAGRRLGGHAAGEQARPRRARGRGPSTAPGSSRAGSP